MISSLEELFIAQLQDAFSAETQLVEALPRMARAATSQELKDGFEDHLEETKAQLEQLRLVCQQVGCRPAAQRCDAMEGLVSESEKIIGMDLEDLARDAGLIIAAQKIEHYEMALYGGLCTLAKELGFGEAAELLHQCLEEEKLTDEKLTQLAEQRINAQAAAWQ